MSSRIRLDYERLTQFCREHGIRKLSLVGSVLRDDFRPDSDVDMRVEFWPDRTPDLFSMAGMQLDLSEMIGRQVDLRTAHDLSRYFRQDVVDTAEVQYLAG